MRPKSGLVPFLALAGALAIAPSGASAQERVSLSVFGGFSPEAMAEESPSPSLGGTLTIGLTPHLDIVGEAGRLDNVLPTLSGSAYSLVGLRAPATFGEAGLRLLASSGPVTPYVEGTAGVARVSLHVDRLGTVGNTVASMALGLMDRTTPTVGAGGGILVRGGPLQFDVGYRYKQLFADDWMQIALGFGQPLRAHQIRAGVGLRF
jgi:hypothetical protein